MNVYSSWVFRGASGITSCADRARLSIRLQTTSSILWRLPRRSRPEAREGLAPFVDLGRGDGGSRGLRVFCEASLGGDLDPSHDDVRCGGRSSPRREHGHELQQLRQRQPAGEGQPLHLPPPQRVHEVLVVDPGAAQRPVVHHEVVAHDEEGDGVLAAPTAAVIASRTAAAAWATRGCPSGYRRGC